MNLLDKLSKFYINRIKVPSHTFREQSRWVPCPKSDVGDNMCVNGIPYSELAEKSRLSVSETHAAVKRLQEASLVNGERKIFRRNAAEFLVHGLKYAFPMKSTGGYHVGMPTLYAAPIAEDDFASVGSVPVWTNSDGSVEGIGFDPIYPTAPKAAEADRGMYDRLALIDMLRGGRLRERKYAEDKLMEMLG